MGIMPKHYYLPVQSNFDDNSLGVVDLQQMNNGELLAEK